MAMLRRRYADVTADVTPTLRPTLRRRYADVTADVTPTLRRRYADVTLTLRRVQAGRSDTAGGGILPMSTSGVSGVPGRPANRALSAMKRSLTNMSGRGEHTIYGWRSTDVDSRACFCFPRSVASTDVAG